MASIQRHTTKKMSRNLLVIAIRKSIKDREGYIRLRNKSTKAVRETKWIYAGGGRTK